MLAPLLCCFGHQPSARAVVTSGLPPSVAAQPISSTQGSAHHCDQGNAQADVTLLPDLSSLITQVERSASSPTTNAIITQVDRSPKQQRHVGECNGTINLEKDLSVKCVISNGGGGDGGRTASSAARGGGSSSGSVGGSGTEPNHNCSQTPSKYLLPNVLQAGDTGRKCLVIDLDETLVHSSFKPVQNADFVVPVEIDGTIHQVYVLKRPHVDEFLQRMGQLYECVLFTASLAKYADPVADLLDKWGVFRARLFRESCVFHRGSYVKDLGRLGRDLSQVIIIDNSPASYIFHPDNAVPVNSWFDDMEDNELLELCPFFESLSKVDNIYTVLRGGGGGGSGGGSVSTSSVTP